MSSSFSSQFKYMFYHNFTCVFTIYGYTKYSQCDQLPVGLIAQLVEHRTGIAEVMGLNPVQTRLFSGFNFTTASYLSPQFKNNFHLSTCNENKVSIFDGRYLYFNVCCACKCSHKIVFVLI